MAQIDVYRRFSVVWGLCLWLFFINVGKIAQAVEFPGPVIQPQDGLSLCGHRVRLPGNAKDYFVSGSSEGFLNLNSYNPVSRSYSILHRFFLGGEVVSLTPWLGRPLGQTGFVVATTNPDRIVFVDVVSAIPQLRVRQIVDLPEDPGDVVFVGNDAIGPWEIAVALPGVDQVVFLTETDDQWSIANILDSGDHPASMVAIDLDGNDTKELVVANTGPLSESLGIYWLEEDGSRSLETVTLAGVKPALVSSFDLNGNGRQELAVAASDAPQVVFYESSSGSLIELEVANLSIVAQSLHQNPLPSGASGLFVSNFERGLVELLQRIDGQWIRVETYYPGCLPWDLTFADIDGDGLDDVITFGGESEVLSAMLGNEKPGFWGYPALSFDKTPGDFDRRDIDGDGRSDLLVADANQTTIRLFFGAADGSLAPVPSVWDLGFIPGRVLAANLDADAQLELVALDIVNGKVAVFDWVADGDLTLLSTISVGNFPFYLSAALVDEDAHLDLLVLTQTQDEVNILYGNGEGGVDEVVSLAFGSPADRIVAMDLNDDSRLDLVATDGQSRVWTILNQGNRQFAEQSFVNAGTGALYMAAGDLDGDGDEDLVVANRTEQSLSFFENNGSGVLIRRIGGHALPGPPFGLVLADFNQDNRLDVLTNLQTEGTLSLVFGLTDWSYALPAVIVGGPAMYAVDAGDFNLDGVPDILILDRSLRLGLTFLNVDPAQVAVEPTAFSATCWRDEIEMEIRPDRPGPWRLEVGHEETWQTVVNAGQAIVGQLDFERGVWYFTLARQDLAGWQAQPDADWRARLTVGAGEFRESAVWLLATGCLQRPAAGRAQLQWQDKPWPNPFNPRVQARFRLAQADQVTATVYDLAGRKVALLVNGPLAAGEHLVSWSGQASGGVASAGTYFLRIAATGQVITQKLILLK